MAPLVRREINSCDAVIGFDLNAHEASWLASALHSHAQTQCSKCPVLFHGEGRAVCGHSCRHTSGHGAHAGAYPYHSCSDCGTEHCSCDGRCTHKEHDYETCPHVLHQACAACSQSPSYCTGHFACRHSCGSSWRGHCGCVKCTVAPPLGKKLKATSPSGR
jgi:hypothetical protein